MSGNSLFGRNIISIDELNVADIEQILSLATKLKQQPNPTLLQQRLIATCFFEPSTRTRLSFTAAALRAGAQVFGFADGNVTSATKGESLADSMRIVGDLADIIVLRHPADGAARLAAEVSAVPVINAGDGANQHPTQTLLDLFSMQQCQGRLQELRVAFVGDLKYGRTVHSLAQACALFNMRLYFVGPDDLTMPEYICHHLREHGIKFSCHQRIEDVLPKLDILYVTRLQRERLRKGEARWLDLPWHVTPELLQQAPAHLRILHPLPRVDEIDVAVDSTPQAYYFEQAKHGLYVRQALLALLCNKEIRHD